MVIPGSFTNRLAGGCRLLVAVAFVIGSGARVALADRLAETELMRVATDLARRYDSNYAAKDPVAMAGLYAADGLLVSPAGPIVRGRDALKAYYVKRFAAGAREHAIKVFEVHVRGDAGYSLARFSVKVPAHDGAVHPVEGTIVALYQHDPDGWHLSLVEPTVPEAPEKH